MQVFHGIFLTVILKNMKKQNMCLAKRMSYVIVRYVKIPMF